MVAVLEEKKKEQDNKPVALNIRTIPYELRRRFKTFCASRSMTMEEAVISLIEEELEKFEIQTTSC